MPSVGIDHPTPGPAPRPVLKQYSQVKLTVPVKREGVMLAVGAVGVIVNDHADGTYSVEFEKPTFEVVTIYASELGLIGYPAL